mmetsp:Transcript_29769/g.39122  ORF Transcript_29769/g.39122 Transcript_29769/m.39122 type:complete len:261 (+) Transcript_29769:207-989(+)
MKFFPLFFFNYFIVISLNFLDYCIPAGTKYMFDPGTRQVNFSRKVLYIHIPKTGGSTIENCYLFRAPEVNHGPIGGHANIDTFQEDMVRDWFKFTVVRHPCERFMSGFRYFNSVKQNAYGQKVIETVFGGPYNSFSDFMEQNGLERMKNVVHFKPQWTFIFRNKTEFGLDRLFYNENFSEVQDYLLSHYPPVKPAHEYFVWRLKTRNSIQTCQGLREKYLQQIESYYHLDYCVFGYVRGKSMPAIRHEDLSARLKYCLRE